MVIFREVVNKRGLDFQNQRKVVMYRSQRPPLSFNKIRKRVKNLEGRRPSEDVVRRVFQRFNVKKGRVQYNYGNCGRTPYKLIPPVSTFLVRQLLKERRKNIVTATSLQADVYKELGAQVSTSAIRKYLVSKGYHWLPRAQKRQYDKPTMLKRWGFGSRFFNRSLKTIHEQFVTLAMDGVVLTVPPVDPVERKNYCFHGVTHMWRKAGEAASPELSGGDPYAEQVPLARAIPLWGAISPKGFSEICFHKTKKLSTDEWVRCCNGGALTQAVQRLKPSRGHAPWALLCDNEKFLDAKAAKAVYKKKHIKLLHIPKRSPELNPIESFWGWLRRALRLRDLRDLRLGRPPLGKTAYKARVKAVLRSKKAQAVAKAKFNRFKKVCQEVVRKKGAASRS